MENQIQIFSNPNLGEVRVNVTPNNEPLFCLADLCSALGISNHRNVRSRLDEEDVHQMDTPTKGGLQSMVYVTEAGMYDVILRSDAPTAKPFRKWVTSEVLPSIRKSGSYSLEAPLSPAELLLRQSQLLVENERKMQELESKQKVLETELAEVKQRTTANLDQSTIVAYVSRNAIKLDVTRYGAMGKKASSLCKKHGIEVTKINDVRWGVVSVYPDTILDEVFSK